MVNALNTEMAGHGVDAPNLRELTSAELEAVSGGLLPSFILGIAFGVGLGSVAGLVASGGALDAIDFSRLRECA
jgi:lactobin A/cerein 7B family class IIb bacteriocin